MQKTTGYLWTQALYTRPINNHNVSYNYPPKLAQDHKNNTFLHDWISLIPPPPRIFKSYRRIFVLWVVFPSSGQDKYTKIFRAAIKPGKFEIATMDTINDVLTTKRFFFPGSSCSLIIWQPFSETYSLWCCFLLRMQPFLSCSDELIIQHYQYFMCINIHHKKTKYLHSTQIS